MRSSPQTVATQRYQPAQKPAKCGRSKTCDLDQDCRCQQIKENCVSYEGSGLDVAA